MYDGIVAFGSIERAGGTEGTDGPEEEEAEAMPEAEAAGLCVTFGLFALSSGLSVEIA